MVKHEVKCQWIAKPNLEQTGNTLGALGWELFRMEKETLGSLGDLEDGYFCVFKRAKQPYGGPARPRPCENQDAV